MQSHACMAQSPNVHDALFLDVSSGISVAGNSFTNEFSPSPAIRFNLRLPFLSGQLEGGIRYIRFSGHANTSLNSDFRSLYIHVGWGYPIKITSWYKIEPVVRAGLNLMHFYQPKVYKNGPFRYATGHADGEFAYELALSNRFRLSAHWFVHTSIWYNRTFTHIPLPITMVSAGVSYALAEPKWLKTFIK